MSWLIALLPWIFIAGMLLHARNDERRAKRETREMHERIDADVRALYAEFPILNELCPLEKP